jgi:purine-nucleoside phosphorylase
VTDAGEQGRSCESGGELARVDSAAAFLRERLGSAATSARLGIVLGSGLKSFAARLEDPSEVPFGDVPGWPAPRVEGHGGSLVAGRVGGTAVACLTGRVHLYEGWSPADVVRAVRTLRRLGVADFLLTNAAGGIADDLSAGDLLLITDHLNLTGSSPLVGVHEPAFGPRFPDQSHVWSPRLRALLERCGARLRPGVYAGLLGPTYETPAEVCMLQTLGADAVGMSTVHEAIALNAMGAGVAGVSLITNLAAGIAERPLSHDEVVAAGAAAAATLESLVTEFCGRLGA